MNRPGNGSMRRGALETGFPGAGKMAQGEIEQDELIPENSKMPRFA